MGDAGRSSRHLTTASAARSMTWRDAALLAGMLGPALFIATFTIEGLLRPGYDPRRMFVSELALGPRGWVQALNFWVLGLLLLAFSIGVAAELSRPRDLASRAGPILLGIISICLFLSGFFATDPIGTPREQMSLTGRLHSLLGALVFSLAPVTCFVFWARFREHAAWHRFARWTLLAGIVTTVSVVGLSVGPAGVMGLIQRTHLVTFLTWIFTFAWRLYQLRRS
jgi:hypothetical membrane protein